MLFYTIFYEKTNLRNLNSVLFMERLSTANKAFLRYAMIAIAVVQVVLCASCSNTESLNGHSRHNVVALLDKAESLLGTDDSTALAILNNIDSQSIRTHKRQAQYALLYSEALYKNYITAPSDSLIMTAVRYYSSTNDAEHQFRAFYILGCIYDELGQTTDAAVALGQAEFLVGKINDNYRSGLLYTQLGNVFFRSYDFSRAEHYYRLANDRYDAAKKNAHKAHSQFDIAGCMIQQKKYQSAHSILKKTKDWASSNKEQGFENTCLLDMVMCSIRSGEYERAETELNEFLDQCKQPIESPHVLSIMAEYYLLTGDKKKAIRNIEKGWLYASSKNDSIKLWYNESLLSELQGAPDSALAKYKHTIELQNQNLYMLLNQPIMGAQKDYYENLAENEKLKISKNRIVLFFTGIFIILVFFSLLIRNRALKMKNEKERQDYLLSIKELRLKEDTNNEIINQLSKKVNALFGRQYSELDRIFNTMIELVVCNN